MLVWLARLVPGVMTADWFAAVMPSPWRAWLCRSAAGRGRRGPGAGSGWHVRRLAKFNITSLADLSVNVVIVWFLARRGVYFLAANFVGITVAVIVNYTFSVAWVWRREK